MKFETTLNLYLNNKATQKDKDYLLDTLLKDMNNVYSELDKNRKLYK